MLIIDYLQLIQMNKSIIRHDLQIDEITRQLKLLAKELSILIVLLCQLNSRLSHYDICPIISYLRESGSVEQDADILC